MSPNFGKALQGGSTTLYANGRLDERALRRQAITKEELDAALRRQGVDGIEDADRIALEPEGTFNVTPKRHYTADDVMRRLDELERRLDSRR
jgi:uncharacterized membrane protein YcaP (DUF421 family)